MRDASALHGLEKLKFKRALRRNMTPAERILWQELRNRKFEGMKWRRQANIDVFIADFLCPEHRLIIEVDGKIHEEQREYDETRTKIIAHHGYRVLRFKNEEILKDLGGVLGRIANAIKTELPFPTSVGKGPGDEGTTPPLHTPSR